MIAARIVLGLLVAAMGTFWVVLALDMGRREDELRAWTPVPAVIDSARVVRGDGHDRRRKVTDYEVVVAYHYVIAGQTYTGNQFGADNRWLDVGGARAAIADLTPGATTTCYVNPGHPMMSVLHIEGSIYRPLSWAFAGLCFVLLYGFMRAPGVRQVRWMVARAAAWRRRKKAPPSLASIVPPRATARRRRVSRGPQS